MDLLLKIEKFIIKLRNRRYLKYQIETRINRFFAERSINPIADKNKSYDKDYYIFNEIVHINFFVKFNNIPSSCIL